MRALTGLALALLILAPHPARAQEPGRAGLVIVRGEGDVVTRCVEFEGDTIDGYDLLAASGLAIQAEQSAMGASICRLDGVGCDFPAESCFCQCQGSPCRYWAYWQQDAAGAWQYAGMGALNSTVSSGEVEGWVWGLGSVSEAPAPPALTFADICAAPVTETLPVTGAQEMAGQEIAGTPAPVAAEPTKDSGGSLQWVGLMAVVVLLPLGALALLRRRGRQG